LFSTSLYLNVKLLIAGALAAVAGSLGLAGFTSSAHAQGSFYYLSFSQSGGFISTVKTDGTDRIPDLVSFPTGMGSPNIGSIGANDTNLYWLTNSFGEGGPSSKVFRAESDGTDPAEILALSGFVSDIGLSPDKLFLTSIVSDPDTGDRGLLGRANLNGSNPELDFLDQASLGGFPGGSLAIDSEHIYYTLAPNGPAPPRIGRVGIDGSSPNPNLVDATQNYYPSSLAAAGGKIFWIEFPPPPPNPNDPPTPVTKVRTADADGSNISEIETGSQNIFGVAADETYVYWGTFGGIGRARHNGTDINPNYITGLQGVVNRLTLGGSAGPPPKPKKASLGKVTVSGPGKVKRGKTATWKVRIPNVGDATATGVRVAVAGRGVKLNTPAASIAPGKARSETIKAKLRKPGTFTVTFKVNTANAGSKIVKRKVTVRR
jgi:hypothetical protein